MILIIKYNNHTLHTSMLHKQNKMCLDAPLTKSKLTVSCIMEAVFLKVRLKGMDVVTGGGNCLTNSIKCSLYSLDIHSKGIFLFLEPY
jgi:hypothetical protein